MNSVRCAALGKYSFMLTFTISLSEDWNLISSRWNFRLSFIPVIPTFML